MYSIDRVVAERRRNGADEYMVVWRDYDHTFITWEVVQDILDKQLLRSWTSLMHGDTHLVQALYEMREAIWKFVWTKKAAQPFCEVTVPIAAVYEVALALIMYLRDLGTSTSEKRLKGIKETKRGRESTKLTINSLEHIGLATLGQFHRPGKAYGALVTHKGQACDNSMFFVGPPFVVE